MDAQQVRRLINEQARLGLPFLFGVDFELKEGFFVEDPLTDSSILFRCGAVGNEGVAPRLTQTPQIEVGEMSRRSYLDHFSIIRDGLLHGDCFLANLTERTPIRTNCSLEEIFYRSGSYYKLYYPNRFVCFSPECFVRIAHGQIHSYPMKGTIDATIPNAEEQLLSNYKELAEHYTIVDLIRNDLSMVAKRVRVARFRYVDRLETLHGEILQTSSEVVGQLDDDWQAHLGDSLFRLLPAGSISGAPKASTLDLIRRAEAVPRGFYTGVFGYFDGQTLDSAVMIRFIEEKDGSLFFRSGGGVTIQSSAEAEYDEVRTKIYLPFV